MTGSKARLRVVGGANGAGKCSRLQSATQVTGENIHFLLGRGVSRSGDQRIGGICWMDWDELVPITGLNQLMGHTPAQSVRYRNTPTSRNICPDINLRYYAVFDGGKLEIKSYDALMVAAKAR